MNPGPPPILDYRTARAASDRTTWIRRAAYFIFLFWPILIGWIWAVREIVRYCSGAAPFSTSAMIVSLMTLAASIGLGLLLRGRK